ncbi:alanine dehydrogenase [Actinomycetota bacterium]
MIIGVPKEIKNGEYRVGLTPAGVRSFSSHNHKVLVERSAGVGSGLSDDDYVKAGAVLLNEPEELYGKSEMIMKVKEPLSSEYDFFNPGQIVFTYFHFASNKELTEAMINKGIIAIAYETVQLSDGYLPLLAPMSEIAGKMAGQIASHYLSVHNGGRGKLMGGVPGVGPVKVVIIGAGSAGSCAAKICGGLGGDVELFDINIKRLRHLEDIMDKNIKLLFYTSYSLESSIKSADVIIGTIYLPGAKADKIINRKMLNIMKPKTLIIDVSIDQGGFAETSHPTTHADPTYVVDDILHYCVANMPSGFPRTSTYALTNATLKYGIDIADKGYIRALKEDESLARGLNIANGKLCCKPIADTHNLKYSTLEECLKKQ